MTRADVTALARAVQVSGPAVDEVRSLAASVAELRGTVAARCGARAPAAGATDRVVAALDRLVATDQLVETARSAVRTADRIGVPGLSWLADRSPWFDPTTDSLVVQLLRPMPGFGRAPGFEAEIGDLGAEVVGELFDPRYSAANESFTLATDPAAFLDNWLGFADGAGESAAALAYTLFGLGSALVPGSDNAVEALTGRRPAEEVTAAILSGLRSMVTDPDAMAAATIDWDGLVEDPHRWSGSLLPDVLIEAATVGVPLTAATRPARAATVRAFGEVGSPPLPDLATFRRAEPEWGPAPEVTSHRQGPFEPPEAWAHQLNGDGPEAPGRNNNCVDCARATEANWRGQDAVAAPLADVERPGVLPDRLEEWAGAPLVPASLDDVADRLTELGPGSSAIITSGWESGGAHAYNAVNDRGVVRWVDGQLGEVSDWPPPYADEVDVSIVIVFGPDGRPR